MSSHTPELQSLGLEISVSKLSWMLKREAMFALQSLFGCQYDMALPSWMDHAELSEPSRMRAAKKAFYLYLVSLFGLRFHMGLGKKKQLFV